MNQIKFNAPWDPLHHVWVGTSYAPTFYEPIRNTRIRDSLQKIASETEEDYNNLVRVLRNFGIQVDRPEINPAATIMNYVNSSGQLNYGDAKSFTLIPKPPNTLRGIVLSYRPITRVSSERRYRFLPGLSNAVTVSTLHVVGHLLDDNPSRGIIAIMYRKNTDNVNYESYSLWY